MKLVAVMLLPHPQAERLVQVSGVAVFFAVGVGRDHFLRML